MPKKLRREMKPSQEKESDVEMRLRIARKEERLKNLLIPYESQIMSFQTVLVWETPYHSLGLFLTVNVLFWLATTLRFFYLVGMTGMILVFLDMWTNHIWPEIRVPPNPNEDLEGWTPVHPRLLSVPEMCGWLARGWAYTHHYVIAAVDMHHRQRVKFFVMALSGFSLLAVIGTFISGFMLIYLTVLSGLLLPCAWYHNLFDQLLKASQPLISWFEEKVNIKRKKKRSKRSKRNDGDGLTDDSDEDLQEFVPDASTVTPKLAASPAKAAKQQQKVTQKPDKLRKAKIKSTEIPPEDEISEDEFDDDSSLLSTSNLLPPQMPSLDPSREQSDDDVEDSMNFSRDLEMPSFDTLDSTTYSQLEIKLAQSLEDTDADVTMEMEHGDLSDSGDEVDTSLRHDDEDSIVTSPSTDAQPAGEAPGIGESIRFVPSHFQDEADEDLLAEGLDFAGHVEEEESDSILTEGAIGRAALLLAQGHVLADAASKTSHLVTETMSNFMSSTMSGLGRLGSSVSQARPATDNSSQQQSDMDSVDAEFEFLDEEELGEFNSEKADPEKP